MIKFTESRIANIDSLGADLKTSLSLLRALTLDEFGELLMGMPDDRFPHLAQTLPSMTPEAIQKQWTGSSGVTLLRQSINFVNFVATSYTLATGKPFRNVTTLDFGCGWGRLLRLLAFYNDPEFNFGCDAWEQSLQHARSVQVDKLATLAKSEPIPRTLPFPSQKFELIYAFSIFTHLSEPSSVACMKALRDVVRPDGVLIITIRPVEFWDWYSNIDPKERLRMRELHMQGKFSFYPINGESILANGQQAYYGDTSIPPDIIETQFPGWAVSQVGTTLTDQYQIFVILRPKS